MNILFISEFVPQSSEPQFKGGVQTRTYHVAKKLKKNHHIDIISLNEGKIEASTYSFINRLIFFVQIIFFKPRNKPDVIEASNTTTYLPAFILAKRTKASAIAWVPDVLGKEWEENFSFLVAKTGKVLEKIGLTLPWDHFIAMSQETKRKLTDLGISPDSISVVYGGVNSRHLSLLKVSKYKKPTICVIARLLPYKRIEDVIRAINIVKLKIPEIQCQIIGEGPEKPNLEALISEFSLENAITISSNIEHNEVMKTLKRSHISCLPSKVEGFGLVTIEAMAAGVPYINSNIPQTKEITQNGKGGLLFTKTSYQELADKIILILSDKDLYQRKKEEGIKLAKKYDWDIIAKQTEEIYKKTQKKRKGQFT